MTSKQVTTIDFFNDADIIFVFDHGEEVTKMRVSSQVLRTSCKTFHTMFGPDFAEGQELDAKNPKEKALDDDVFAMKTIFQVLHHKCEKIPRTFDLDELKTIAQVIDKYGLNDAMKYAMQDWLDPIHHRQIERNEFIARMCTMLKIAVELKYPMAFKWITLELLRYSSVSYYHLMPWAFSSISSWKMLNSLTAERTRIRNEILNLILSYPQTNTNGPCSCANSYFGDFSIEATNAGLIPRQMDNTDIDNTFFTVLSLPEPAISGPCGSCGRQSNGGWGNGDAPFNPKPLRANLLKSVLNLQTSVKGLCFHCIYEEDINKRQCSCATPAAEVDNDHDEENAY